MENSDLKNRVIKEIESLIIKSCPKNIIVKKYQHLHESILKKHYNAVDISIDYHRKRAIMYIVMDDSSYDPKKMNLSLPLLRTNIIFKDLGQFLISCLDRDTLSIVFYAKLLKGYDNHGENLSVPKFLDPGDVKNKPLYSKI